MNWNAQTILVVEDDREQAELLSQYLEKRGHTVLLAPNAAQALSQKTRPHFILLDLNLPDRDGIQLCGDLRVAYPGAFIMMLTARKEEMDRIIGLEVGADDYVTKPYSLREVEARIRAIIRRHQPPPNTAQQTNPTQGLQMDEGRCAARFEGKSVELTAQEFRVLNQMVRYPERIFSRNQLINSAWDEGIFVTDRVVDAMVARLRKKLRKHFGYEFIFTKHGLGYGYQPQG